MVITEEDRSQWFDNPVTQSFLKDLRDTIQETQNAWAREVFVGSTLEQSALMNAKALGGLDLLNQVIERIEAHKPQVVEQKTGEHDDRSSY
jgi:hypothetical protein